MHTPGQFGRTAHTLHVIPIPMSVVGHHASIKFTLSDWTPNYDAIRPGAKTRPRVEPA